MPDTPEDYAVWRSIHEVAPRKFKTYEQKAFFDTSLPEEDRPHYELLDRKTLHQFQMLKPDGTIILSIPFKEGQGGRLIWRRRVQMMPGMGVVPIYIVGKRGAFVAAILPDYSIILDDNFDENNALLGDIDKVSGEE